MFFGITGSICAGRETIAQYLVEQHGFQRLYVGGKPRDSGPQEKPAQTILPIHLKFESNGILSDSSLDANSGQQPDHFPSVEELLDFVTRNWQSNWVTTFLPSEHVLDQYSRRPFFLLVSVDAPLTVRWKRYQDKHKAAFFIPAVSSFEDFVSLSDAWLYDPATGKLPLMSRAAVRLVNSSSSLPQLRATLARLDLLHADRLRPSWDAYFMALASLAAQRSNCMKRRVGCVLVRDQRVISTGYNGTPRHLPNCAAGGCPRCNDGHRSGVGLATCLCIHAEENALLEAGRERVREGAVLYCDTCPCLTCSIKIVQVGIREVVYSQEYSMDGDTARVFTQAGVRLRKFVPPPNGLVHLERLTVDPEEDSVA